MLISVILFAVGLVLLIKGGDWFVDGATGIAKRFNLQNRNKHNDSPFDKLLACRRFSRKAFRLHINQQILYQL